MTSYFIDSLLMKTPADFSTNHLADNDKTKQQARISKHTQGTTKNNPLGKILYLRNFSRFFSPNLQHLQTRIQFTYSANFIKIANVV